MKKYLLLLIFLIPSIVFGMGYTSYDSTTSLCNDENCNSRTNYYLYDLPPRYIGDTSNGFTRMIIYNGVRSYETYKDKWFTFNSWVGDNFSANLRYNNQNLFLQVSNEFNYNLYGSFDWLNGNQRYIALQFASGENTTTTEDQFWNPNATKENGYYDFDFDIYLKTDITDITWNNMVSYNNQGFQCRNVNSFDLGGSPTDFNCWVNRFTGSYIQFGQDTYFKTTYHITHGKFMPNSYKDNLPSSFKTNLDSNDIWNNEYTYIFDSPFMTNFSTETEYLANFKFWVSNPYNIKYYSTEPQIFLNNDRIRNTDFYNNNINCSEESCQDYNVNEGSILEQIFKLKPFEEHGFNRILQTIYNFFDSFLSYNTCHNLDLPINIRNHEMHFTIPSGCVFWNRNDNTFKQTYELIINGLITYMVFMKIYHELLRVANPDWLPTNKELMQL